MQLSIRPSRGWTLPDPGEIWRYRGLFGSLAARDLKVRYKQTLLGVAWVVLQPLLAAGVFAFVFGQVAAFEAPGGVPYFLFSFVGLLAWNAFRGSVDRVSSSLVGNYHLISKIYFPRLVLPAASLLATLVDLAVALALGFLLLALDWHVPATIVALPLVLLVLLALGLGIGLVSAALTVHYRDVQHFVPFLLQFLLYASPVAYAVEEVPERYLAVYSLNPLVGLLEAFRWSMLGVGEVPWGAFAYAAAVAAALLAAGILVFRRMEDSFADVI